MLMQWDCNNDNTVQKIAHSDGEKEEVEAWLDHVQLMIMTLQFIKYKFFDYIFYKIFF